IAITIAPPPPPPPTLERMEDMSRPELVAPATADAPALDMTMFNSWPPIPPPTIPAIEFPMGHKLRFFRMAPARLPPTAPLISRIIRGIIRIHLIGAILRRQKQSGSYQPAC